MGAVKKDKTAEEFIAEQQAKFRERLAAQKVQLGDELRRCTRCGWQARKSECLAMGIKACPQCGNPQCIGLSLDFDSKMLKLGQKGT